MKQIVFIVVILISSLGALACPVIHLKSLKCIQLTESDLKRYWQKSFEIYLQDESHILEIGVGFQYHRYNLPSTFVLKDKEQDLSCFDETVQIQEKYDDLEAQSTLQLIKNGYKIEGSRIVFHRKCEDGECRKVAAIEEFEIACKGRTVR